jgi:hypothetical protein
MKAVSGLKPGRLHGPFLFAVSKLLSHWIAHNQARANGFRQWATRVREIGQDETAERMAACNQALDAALKSLGGNSTTFTDRGTGLRTHLCLGHLRHLQGERLWRRARVKDGKSVCIPCAAASHCRLDGVGITIT